MRNSIVRAIALIGLGIMLASAAFAGGPGEGTVASAETFSPANMSPLGTIDPVAQNYFPTEIISMGDKVEVSLNNARIGDAKFSGNAETVVWQPDNRSAYKLTRFSTSSNSWTVYEDTKMSTSGSAIELTGAWKLGKRWVGGLAVVFNDKPRVTTSWPGGSVNDEYSDYTWDAGSTELKSKASTEYRVGAKYMATDQFSILAAYAKKKGTVTMLSTPVIEGEGDNWGDIEPMSFDSTSITIAGKQSWKKASVMAGFQGSETNGFWQGSGSTLRTFIGGSYRVTRAITVRAGSIDGSRDIAAEYTFDRWRVGAGYSNNGLNTADGSGSSSAWIWGNYAVKF